MQVKVPQIMPGAQSTGPGLQVAPSPGKVPHTPSALHIESREHRRLGSHVSPGSCRAVHVNGALQKSAGAQRLTVQLPPSGTSVVGFRHVDWSHCIPSSQTTISPSHAFPSLATIR